MSRSDSNFEQSNISLKYNKWDGVELNSSSLEYCVRKNEEKFYGFRQTARVKLDSQELIAFWIPVCIIQRTFERVSPSNFERKVFYPYYTSFKRTVHPSDSENQLFPLNVHFS